VLHISAAIKISDCPLIDKQSARKVWPSPLSVHISSALTGRFAINEKLVRSNLRHELNVKVGELTGFDEWMCIPTCGTCLATQFLTALNRGPFERQQGVIHARRRRDRS
jgi:hypothetical protein